jgi:phosphoribosylglycinamide formyltransferase 1
VSAEAAEADDRGTTPRLAVLASGRGTNLQAILDAIAAGSLPARVAGVFSDRPGCGALIRVEEDRRWAAAPAEFPDRAAFDVALGDAVAACRPDWVVCAGYLRILGDPFVARFRGRLLNIHPSLLPRHRGLRTHARALAAGDREHGASVHFVTPELDAGAVVAQARLAIAPGDTAERLAQRVLALEHPLLVATLRLALAGRLAERGASVLLDGHPLFNPLRLESDGNLHAESAYRRRTTSKESE